MTRHFLQDLTALLALSAFIIGITILGAVA